jgi:hypothetical protein
MPEAGANPFHQPQPSRRGLDHDRCTAYPEYSRHVRCSIRRLQATVNGDFGTDRSPKPLLQLRTTDNQKDRRPDAPSTTSTFDTYRCRLHDRGARRPPLFSHAMRVRTNLHIRRNHRLTRRQLRDRSMTEPMHIQQTGAHGRRRDDGDRQDKGGAT